MELGFEMVFSFVFYFGNKYFGLGNSFPIFFSLEFCSNIYAFGVGFDGLLFKSHDNRVVNKSCTLAVPMLSFVMVLALSHLFL